MEGLCRICCSAEVDELISVSCTVASQKRTVGEMISAVMVSCFDFAPTFPVRNLYRFLFVFVVPDTGPAFQLDSVRPNAPGAGSAV